MGAPGQFLPRKSGAHRIACIALYRALLIQCPKIPLPADLHFTGTVNPIIHFIRRRFKKNVFHVSPRIVVPALKAGYAAESLLRSAASGNTTSISQIYSLLRLIHAQSAASRAANPPELIAALKAKRPQRPEAWRGAKKLLDVRPVGIEEIKGGRRIVPKVALAQWIPFLRVKKPQSEFLSRVIKNKMEQKQKRMDLMEQLDGWVEMGEAEDIWDGVVREQIEEERRLMEGDENEDEDEDGEEWNEEEEDEDWEDEEEWDEDEDTVWEKGQEKQNTGETVAYTPLFSGPSTHKSPILTTTPHTHPLHRLPPKSSLKAARLSEMRVTRKALRALDNSETEKPWMAEPFLVKANIQHEINKTYAKAYELTNRMVEIADREKELAEEEGRERRHRVREKGWERKKGRKCWADGGVEKGGRSGSRSVKGGFTSTKIMVS